MTRGLFLASIWIIAGCGGVTVTPDPSELGDDDDSVIGDDDDVIGDDDDDDVSATAPVAVDDALTVDEDGQAQVDVGANDTDPTGDLAVDTVAIVDTPLNGDAVLQPGGVVGYRHNGSETVTDSFTYTISDLNGELSNVATVNITVNPINDPPRAFDDAFAVDEGGAANFSLVLNDVDEDDGLDLTSIVITSQPFAGTAVVLNDGTIDYTNDGSEEALDSLTYTIDDMSGVSSNEAFVDITINPINDLPVAIDDLYAVYTGRTTNLRINDNDIDAEGFDLTSIAIQTQPINGTLALIGNGTVDYTHSGDGSVLDSFTYTITDTDGAVTNVATVDLTISVAPPCGGWDWNNGCWYNGNEGESCEQTCAANCGFDPITSQHAGNTVGFNFWPGKAFGGDWVAIECSSTDNNTNWGANNTVPDGLYTFQSCHLNCSCGC